MSDFELFDDAKETFPAKEDLKDRLVAIWVTGKTGQRKSEASGKAYDWVETVTLVLDDGPDGASATDLVPAAPQTLDGFQWSTGGMTSRLIPRANAKNARPMLGRINSRKNSRKGFSDSWSISEPTAEDKEAAMKFADRIKEITGQIQSRLAGVEDAEAFD